MSICLGGCVLEQLFVGQGGTRFIRTQRAGALDGVRHRGDVGGIQLVQLGDVVEDVGELLAVEGKLPVAEFEMGEFGNMFDFFGCE